MSRIKSFFFLLFLVVSFELSAFKSDEDVTPEEREKLRLAVETNDMAEVCRLITEGGLSPNTRDGTSEYRMPMHHAASPEMVMMLWSLNAELDGRDAFGMTPLHVAAFAFENDVVALLLHLGAQHLIEDADSHVPWDLTTRFCPEAIREQLAFGINFDEPANTNAVIIPDREEEDDFKYINLPRDRNRVTLYNFES